MGGIQRPAKAGKSITGLSRIKCYREQVGDGFNSNARWPGGSEDDARLGRRYLRRSHDRVLFGRVGMVWWSRVCAVAFNTSLAPVAGRSDGNGKILHE